MAQIAHMNLHSKTQLGNLLELSRDYCSDQLGRFFQNKYSLPALAVNKFEIPANLVTRNEQNCFAICVIMNNHIMNLKYFSDISPGWDNQIGIEKSLTEQTLEKINIFVNDQRLQSIIRNFKKINDEIVIGRCRGSEFTPL